VTTAVFDDPVTNYAGELRGFPDKLKDISLLGTDNLTFSSIASKSETAKSVRHLATTSHQADLNKHGSAMFYPYSYQVLELCKTTTCLLGSWNVFFSGLPNSNLDMLPYLLVIVKIRSAIFSGSDRDLSS
jgi:hypothetical protein